MIEGGRKRGKAGESWEEKGRKGCSERERNIGKVVQIFLNSVFHPGE